MISVLVDLPWADQNLAYIDIAQFTWLSTITSLSEDNVLIVIGGDTNYKDEDEGARSVISRWAKRKVASQFREEYLDGRQSFIFSWNEKHRPVHEEAMRHFLDPGKRGSKFEYTPPKPLPKPIEPKVSRPLPTPILPLEPPTASAGQDLGRKVGYNLNLTINSRINQFFQPQDSHN